MLIGIGIKRKIKLENRIERKISKGERGWPWLGMTGEKLRRDERERERAQAPNWATVARQPLFF